MQSTQQKQNPFTPLLLIVFLLLSLLFFSSSCDIPVTTEENTVISSFSTVTEKTKPVIDSTNYFKEKPFNTFTEYVAYFSNAAKTFEDVYKIPYEYILAKSWSETQAGKKGAGRRGAIFGIKGKGIKGFDSKEKHFKSNGKVEYTAYSQRWQAYSHFCKLLTGETGNKMYMTRFIAWNHYFLKNKVQKPDWYMWALATQVHPQLKKSRSAYASCGCLIQLKEKTKKEDLKCYNKRRKHALKNINLITNYIIEK